MKSSQFLTEAQKDPAYGLFENLRRGTDARTRADLTRMHENFVVPYNKYLTSINQMLVEREMTAAEINQLFTGAAQGAQASGTNSTMIGRLLPDAIKKKFEAELPAADAGPVEGFEQKAAQAAQQIQDPAAKQTAMQMIQTGMKNPVAQRLVMAALGGAITPMVGKVAFALGGGPIGAAAAGGIVGGLLAVAMAKMQGQSWKDAGISGLKGAAVGAAAGALGQVAGAAVSQMGNKMFGGGDASVGAGGGEISSAEAKMLSQREEQGRLQPGDAEKLAQWRGDDASDPTGMGADSDYRPVDTGSLRQGPAPGGVAFPGDPGYVPSGQNTPTTTSYTDNYIKVGGERVIPGQDLSPVQMAATQAAISMGNQPNPGVYQQYLKQGGPDAATMASPAYQQQVMSAPSSGKFNFESRQRMIDRDATVKMWYLRESVGKRRGGVQLTQEGLGDVLKGATDWIKTKAGNLTQKVTPDKIQQAYKKAGSPTDSDKVYQVLKDAGVDPAITDKLYADMGIPMPGATDPNAAAATDPNAAAATDPNAAAATDPNAAAATAAADPNAPAADAAAGGGAKKRLGYNDGKAAVDQMISTLKTVRSEYRAKVMAHATAKLGELNKAPAQPEAQPAAPVTGTPGVQGAVAGAPAPAAPAAAVAESRVIDKMSKDFARFLDRLG
jgi:hypothetical protein